MDDDFVDNKFDDDEETAQKSIRPDFLRAHDAKEAAASKLSSAENAAANSDIGKGGGGLYKAKDAEAKSGFYSRGKKSGASIGSLKGGKFKGKISRKGPIIGIFLAVFGVGGIITGTQVFQPFSLIAQFQETFNSMHTSANTRAKRFFKAQMDNKRTKNPIKGNKIFGYSFKISDKQNEKLKQQGIEFDDSTFTDSKGKPIKVLKHDDGSGKIKVIAADESSADELTKLNLSKYDTDDIKFDTKAVDFASYYYSNTDFFQKYNAGSMTWRGVVANWFGTNTANFLKNNRLTRNMFQDYKKKVAESDGDSLKATKEIIGSHAGTIEDGGQRVMTKEGEDDDGKAILGTDEPEKESMKRSDFTKDSVRAKLDKISSKFNKAANITCALVGAIGAINLLVQASEALQIINITTAYFETVDKTKYGLGDDAPIHDLSNALNERKSGTYEVIADDDSEMSGSIASSIISGLKNETVTTEPRTAMESAGVSAQYSGGIVDPNDISVKSFNLTASSNKLLGGLGESMESFRNCAIAKMGADAVSLVIDGIEVSGCVVGLVGAIFTFGTSTAACGPLLGSIGKSIAAGIALSVALGALVSMISPVVTNMLTRDLISDLGGEDLGNALTSGANMYQGGTHRASGGSLTNPDHLKQFALTQQQVIAENAQNERLSLSPFDARSKYTFLGSIINQMMSYRNTSTIMGALTKTSSVMSSSLIGMSDAASAYNVAKFIPNQDDYAEYCPYLSSIGAVGDSFCNQYVITDLDTIDNDPADVIDTVDSYGGFADEETTDGNVIIKNDSELADFIRYCDNRSSAFGIPDQNIAVEVGNFASVNTGSTTFNNTTNGAIGAVPVVGDAIDIIQNKQQLNYVGFISGESCVAGNEVTAASSPNWSKAKDYQRFIEDQSLAESMGLVEKSAVTAYLEDYYEKNPLDNSYEGILARYSGLTKDTVVALLNVIEYYNYIAEYDPSDRYAFGAPLESPEGEKATNLDNEYLLAGGVTLLNTFEYRDVRNRVMTV